MIRRLTLLAIALAVTGCATHVPSVPTTHDGPTAHLQDSVRTISGSQAEFFVAEALDGAAIDNSLVATLVANRGRGMQMTPVFRGRPLVAGKPVRVGVKGRTHFAAPILAMAGTVYQVKGVVEFTPAVDGRYVVRGELAEAYSAVWIEDVETHQPVGNKVEVSGSAKLGFFEK